VAVLVPRTCPASFTVDSMLRQSQSMCFQSVDLLSCDYIKKDIYILFLYSMLPCKLRSNENVLWLTVYQFFFLNEI
jgi:hypothetical protein